MTVAGRMFSSLLLALIVCSGVTTTGQEEKSRAPAHEVSAEELLARPVGANWPSYNGDYTGQRFSSLQEINVSNVGQLRAAWVFHPGNSQRLEATPVVIRVMM